MTDAKVTISRETLLPAATIKRIKKECDALGLDIVAFAWRVQNAALAAQPADEMSPEFTDTARNALLWVLWHHQGASSKVGQAMRFALGMGDHDRLTERQIADAKRWSEPVPGLAHAPAQPADAMPGECLYPECSSDPTSCPENEGYGCCKIAAQPATVQPVEPVAWRDHVEQRIQEWRHRTMNADGDRLALNDYMRQDAIDDLVDYVCDEHAAPPAPAPVPPGWKLVPIKPTPAMIASGAVALVKASHSDIDPTMEEVTAAYRAMIAAGDK